MILDSLPEICCVVRPSAFILLDGLNTSSSIVAKMLPLISSVKYLISARYFNNPFGSQLMLVPVILRTNSCVMRPWKASGNTYWRFRPVMISSLSFDPNVHCSWWERFVSSISTRTLRRLHDLVRRFCRRKDRSPAYELVLKDVKNLKKRTCVF